MAKYAQLHGDDALMALKHGLAKELLLALMLISKHEDLDVPINQYEKAIKKLEQIGIHLSLDRVLGEVIAKRSASKRYYEKTQAKKKASDIRDDIRPDDSADAKEDITTPLSLSLSSSPTEKKGGRAPRAPKQPSKGRRALDAFNAAVTEVTGSPSTTMGISMERKAAAMQDAIDAAGETWTQAVKRRHDLGKSLNLHWMANDYASDRTMRQRPTLVRPNLSNNLLQHDNHPEGAGEEYWLQGIEKYKYGGTNG